MKCPYCKSEVYKMSVKDHANAEIAEQDFKEEVSKEKEKLRQRSPLFPWRLKLVKV